MVELLSVATLLSCFIFIIILLRFFGKNGLYVYGAIAVIISNIQVLKLTQYSFVDFPVALGTVVFSTIFAVDNILTEHYGLNSAKKSVYISFAGYIFFTLIMQITNMHPFVEHSECINMHFELIKIFDPAVAILSASLISYFISQMSDVYLFDFLKRVLRGKLLPLRSFAVMSIATFLDNMVFSVLAWIVFAKNPISFSSLFTTYVLATYFMRLLVSAACVILVKYAAYFITEEENV